MESFPRILVAKDGQVLTIDLARPEDVEEVSEFRRLHFFPTSPNCYLVKVGPEDDQRLKENALRCLEHSVSLIARDSAGQLAAMAMNKFEERTNAVYAAPPSSNNPSLALILSLINTLESEIDLFAKYNTDRILYLAAIAVDKRYGRLGLASTLVELSLELAKINGAGGVKTCAVSEYAAKAAARHGLETMKAINYATFELNGEKPLAQMSDLLSEHRAARLMARRIP